MISYRAPLGALTFVMACGTSSAFAAEAVPNYVTAALGQPWRPQLEVFRDSEMKAGEIMAYAGVRPGMTVADLMPEGGYWTRIMSGIVGNNGAVYMVIPMGPGGSRQKSGRGPLWKDANQNEPMDRVSNALAVADQTEFKNNTTVFWAGGANLGTVLSVPKQVDVVISEGDYHVLKSDEFKRADLVEANKGIYRGMNNGGAYVIIDTTRSISPDVVKKDVLAAGFTLDGENNMLASSGRFVLRFRKPMNAPNTNKRPADIKAALAGYFGITRQSNPGLISIRPAPPGTSGLRERRVMYHEDLTYHEYGQTGSGDNPWQSGWIFYNADGEGCMWHSFPTTERSFIACSEGRAAPNKKIGESWWGEDRIYRFIGKGYVPFPNKPAEPGGTLGNTPLEIARGFGEVFKTIDDVHGTDSYRREYLAAYRAFRNNHKDVPRDALDKELEKAYGKPMPQLTDD